MADVFSVFHILLSATMWLTDHFVPLLLLDLLLETISHAHIWGRAVFYCEYGQALLCMIYS